MVEINIKKLVTFRSIFFLILCMCSVAFYLGGPMFYGFLVVYSFWKVFKRTGSCSYNFFAVLFILIAIVSTLVNLSETEAIFKPQQRIMMLILVMLAFSPIITNRGIYAYRKKLFIYFLVSLSITSLISSVLGLIGKGFVGPYLVGWYDFPNSLGYAQGLTIVSLSSCIAIASKKLKLLCILGIIITIIAIPLTGTRTAFYSVPIVLLGYVFLRSSNIKKLVYYLFIFGIGALVFYYTVSLDMSIIDQKNELHELQGSSRDGLFDARIKEYKQSPIIGIGTFRADLKLSNVNENGNVEAGNSFLMMLSMNGLLGAINFCVLYLSILISFVIFILKKRKVGLSPFEIMLSLVMLYNLISMQQMGLLLNAGLYFTGINWITLALAYKIDIYDKIRDERAKIVLYR